MVVHSIPPASTTLNPSIDFVAPLNLASGNYEFENVKVDFQELDPRSVYIIEKMTVSASIENSDFTVGRVEPIFIERFYKQSPQQRAQHFPDLLEVPNVNFPIDMNTVFYSSDARDFLQLKLSGAIKQQISMIDSDSVVLTVSATIYRIGNQAFVNKVKKEWGQ